MPRVQTVLKSFERAFIRPVVRWLRNIRRPLRDTAQVAKLEARIAELETRVRELTGLVYLRMDDDAANTPAPPDNITAALASREAA